MKSFSSLAARASIGKISDLKGKSVGVDAPGTASYFGLAWILMKNGMTLKDVNLVTLSPQAAATAFVAGQNDQICLPFFEFIQQVIRCNQIIPGENMSLYLQTLSSFQHKRVRLVRPY